MQAYENGLFAETVELMARGRQVLIAINSPEEEKMISSVAEVAKKLNKDLKTWSITHQQDFMPETAKRNDVVLDPSGIWNKEFYQKGLQDPTEKNRQKKLIESDAMKILNRIILDTTTETGTTNTWYLLKDFPSLWENPQVIRRVKDLFNALVSSKNTVFITSAAPPKLPDGLEKIIKPVKMGFPSEKEISRILNEQFLPNLPKGASVNLSEEENMLVIRGLKGLTEYEINTALSTAAVKLKGQMTADMIDIVQSEKETIVNQGGKLEIVKVTDEEVGGLDNLQTYIRKRGKAFSPAAKAYGLPDPKGILLAGVQGCGKSLCAKVIARKLKLMLVRLDMGRQFGSLVGESESNLRDSLARIDAVDGVVLWIEEIDKSLSGMQGGGDSGTSSRVLQDLLTWLQERKSRTYVVMTANDMSNLPPELTREGRIDARFFVDLPNSIERSEIASIHLKKRGRNPQNFDIQRIVDETDGFSGAEIEGIVITSLFDAFDNDEEVNTEYIVTAAHRTVPTSKTYGEKIAHLREHAKNRFQMATAPITVAAAPIAAKTTTVASALEI